MNANLLFKWLRDPRFAPEREAGAGSCFLPVEIGLESVDMSGDARTDLPAGRVHIELVGGHRVVAGGGFDPDRLGRLLKVWLS